LSHPFIRLLNEGDKNRKVLRKCKQIIMHQIGYVFGMVTEVRSDADLDEDQMAEFLWRCRMKQAREFGDGEPWEDMRKISKHTANYMKTYDLTNFESWTTKTVMYYPLPASWLPEDEKRNIPPRTELTEADVSFIKRYYTDSRPEDDRVWDMSTMDFDEIMFPLFEGGENSDLPSDMV
jgi:hypothetical protein